MHDGRAGVIKDGQYRLVHGAGKRVVGYEVAPNLIVPVQFEDLSDGVLSVGGADIGCANLTNQTLTDFVFTGRNRDLTDNERVDVEVAQRDKVRLNRDI